MDVAETAGAQPHEVEMEKESVRKRQECWLARGETEDGARAAAGWRNHKRARSASYHQMRYSDNQLTFTTGFGLKQYRVELEDEETPAPDPLEWQRLTCAMDQEGTNICMVMARIRLLNLCIEAWWGFSH